MTTVGNPETYLVDDGLWKRARLEPFNGWSLHDLSTQIGTYWGNPGIRVERGKAQCLRLPRRSFQDEVDDRERSDYYGDDDDDPDADGSDHSTTLATISPRLACAKR